jgi:hypothetical protein
MKLKKVHTQVMKDQPGKTQEVYRMGKHYITLVRDTDTNADVEMFYPFDEWLKEDIAAQTAISVMVDDVIADEPEKLALFRKTQNGRALSQRNAVVEDYFGFFLSRALFLSNYKADIKRLSELVMRTLNKTQEK